MTNYRIFLEKGDNFVETNLTDVSFKYIKYERTEKEVLKLNLIKIITFDITAQEG